MYQNNVLKMQNFIIYLYGFFLLGYLHFVVQIEYFCFQTYSLQTSEKLSHTIFGDKSIIFFVILYDTPPKINLTTLNK